VLAILQAMRDGIRTVAALPSALSACRDILSFARTPSVFVPIDFARDTDTIDACWLC